MNPVPINDIQTPTPLRSGQIYMKVNSKFAIFSFWDMVIQNLTSWLNKIHTKRCTMFWNEFFSSWAFFSIFSFWDMIDFVLNIRSELVWDLGEFRNLSKNGNYNLNLFWIKFNQQDFEEISRRIMYLSCLKRTQILIMIKALANITNQKNRFILPVNLNQIWLYF